jgi:hypothetical protein
MATRTHEGVVHGYDVARRQVLCGCSGQTHSTKHAVGVTCTACRELLGRAPGAHVLAGAPAPDTE